MRICWTFCPPTCAAAPVIRTSSRRCAPPRPRCERRDAGYFRMSSTRQKYVGRSMPRKEDEPLLRGRGRFAADINFPDQLHMRVVRSTFAHGRIVAVDLKPALAIPGVHAAWSFADVAEIPPIDFRLTGLTALAPYRQTILARDRVRYVGDPVAVVFAEDPYLAEDAAEHVEVDIEELPVLLHADTAPGEFA